MKYQVLVHNPFRNLKNNARWLKWLMNFNARRFTLTTPPFAGKFEPNYFFDFKQLIVNLSGQILENSSKNFPKFQFFRGVTQTDFWKTHPSFRIFKFSWGFFWKTSPYLDEFSRNRPVSSPKIIKLTIG